jgi:hypothetical protein
VRLRWPWQFNVQREDWAGFEQRQFANSATGHKQLIGWLLKGGGIVRVSLEATGVYSLDVALEHFHNRCRGTGDTHRGFSVKKSRT